MQAPLIEDPEVSSVPGPLIDAVDESVVSVKPFDGDPHVTLKLQVYERVLFRNLWKNKLKKDDLLVKIEKMEKKDYFFSSIVLFIKTALKNENAQSYDFTKLPLISSLVHNIDDDYLDTLKKFFNMRFRYEEDFRLYLIGYDVAKYLILHLDKPISCGKLSHIIYEYIRENKPEVYDGIKAQYEEYDMDTKTWSTVSLSNGFTIKHVKSFKAEIEDEPIEVARGELVEQYRNFGLRAMKFQYGSDSDRSDSEDYDNHSDIDD